MPTEDRVRKVALMPAEDRVREVALMPAEDRVWEVALVPAEVRAQERALKPPPAQASVQRLLPLASWARAADDRRIHRCGMPRALSSTHRPRRESHQRLRGSRPRKGRTILRRESARRAIR